MVDIKHEFQSFQPDGPDTSRVQASNWNAPHVLAAGTDGYFLVRDSTDPSGMALFPGVMKVLASEADVPNGFIGCVLTGTTYTFVHNDNGTYKTIYTAGPF